MSDGILICIDYLPITKMPFTCSERETGLAAIFLFLEGWVGLYYSAWDKVLQLFN